MFTTNDMGLARLNSIMQNRLSFMEGQGSLSADNISLLSQVPPNLGDRVVKIKNKLDNAEDISMLPDEGIVVADQYNGFIRLFDRDGHFEKTLVRGIRPLGVTANRSGLVYFTDSFRKKEKLIKVYSLDGTFITQWGEEKKWKPRGLAISNKGLLVVADAHPDQQYVGLYTQDGKELSRFGSKGTHSDQFNNPWYVHVDLFDRILVSDHNNHAVKIWDDRGKLLGSVGEQGSEDGQLLRPRGVMSDGNGNIIVADTGNRRVSLFSPDGTFIQHILTKAEGIGYPYGLGYSRTSSRLAVSQHSSESGDFRKIRVYELDNPHSTELP